MQPNELTQLAHDAFIRRAAELDLPFMLKGSNLTRQYYRDAAHRISHDLDWIYFGAITNSEQAKEVFDHWMTTITEMQLFDGVVFRSFKEDAFWRQIDYAMADDFPTVNTDLVCWINGEEVGLRGIDISFNLPLGVPPRALLYQPLQGKAFNLPYTTPLALQVSWKLHQTMVRPRFKDLQDLMELLRHPSFSATTLQQAWTALLEECAASHVSLEQLTWLLDGNLHNLWPEDQLTNSWNDWRHHYKTFLGKFSSAHDNGYNTIAINYIDGELNVFLRSFCKAMEQAGFTTALLAQETPVPATLPVQRNPFSPPQYCTCWNKTEPEKINTMEQALQEMIHRETAAILDGDLMIRQYFKDPALRKCTQMDWQLPQITGDETSIEQKANKLLRLPAPVAASPARFSLHYHSFFTAADSQRDATTASTSIMVTAGNDWVGQWGVLIQLQQAVQLPVLPFAYCLTDGSVLDIPHAVSLAALVTKKLCRTLIQPRFGDLFDLIHLLSHPAFTSEVKDAVWQALQQQCARENIPASKMQVLLNGGLTELFTDYAIGDAWMHWRFDMEGKAVNWAGIANDRARYITDPALLPMYLPDFIQQFYAALKGVGF